MTSERRESKRYEVEKVIDEYLQLGENFETPPKIILKMLPFTPQGELIGVESVASSTAIQCYAPGVAFLKNRTDEKAIGISESTLEAGHHTTRMHVNYTFQLIGLTRSVTHDVFNAHPFQNTEQQSQRYVEAKAGNYLVPKDLNERQKVFYEQACVFSNKAYFNLLKLLQPEVEKRVRSMNPEGGWRVEKTKIRLEGKIQKLSQEIARYVLPIGQHTTYFHTINELMLLRLFRASKMPNFTNEARFVIGSMVNEVAKVDPSILNELDVPINHTNELDSADNVAFDSFLGDKQSKLMSQPQTGQFGQKLVFDLRLLADTFEIGMLDSKTSTLRNVWLTFASKMSHAADSQRQRHRRTASNMPDINTLYNGSADYMTPMVIRDSPELKKAYDAIMKEMFGNVEKALEMGIPREYALLLIPNSLNIRVIESGDLFDWVHRWKQRLCYLAQEEIFFVALDQVIDLEKVMPGAKPMLMAPCGIRKAVGVSPRCPEGDRFCGQPVFNWQLDKYAEHRLI